MFSWWYKQNCLSLHHNPKGYYNNRKDYGDKDNEFNLRNKQISELWQHWTEKTW